MNISNLIKNTNNAEYIFTHSLCHFITITMKFHNSFYKNKTEDHVPEKSVKTVRLAPKTLRSPKNTKEN